MVKLTVPTKCNPLCHRLNALAVARTNQPRHVERAHLSPCFVTQPIQKRLQPTSKLISPVQCPANHGRPSKRRPPMSHRKTDLGIPSASKSAKVVLVQALKLRSFAVLDRDANGHAPAWDRAGAARTITCERAAPHNPPCKEQGKYRGGFGRKR